MAKLANIELFDLYVGKILATLYESFPVRTHLDICEGAGADIDEDTLQVPLQCQIYKDTVIWLKDSGYIIYANEHTYSFTGVVLTAKSLELLKRVPKSLKSSYGEKLVALLKDGSEDALKQSVNTLLSASLDIFK